jgi:tight adherence protein C
MFALLRPENLISLIVAMGCFATVLVLARPMLAGDKLAIRLKSVAQQREELRRKSRSAMDAKPQGLRQTSKGVLAGLVEKLQLQKLLEDPNLRSKLMQAGMRGPGPTQVFYFGRLALPVAAFFGSLIYLRLFGAQFGIPPNLHMAAVAVATALGFYAPNIYLSNVIAKRKQSIMRAFPDALDMLLICVESGMSIELALQRVANEIGSASVELAEELALATAELAYLQERRFAYENLARRTDDPGVKSVALALIQAERYGTPLGAALRVLAKENRDMRMAAAEKKAAALPAQLTVPMILFFLPVLFVVILGPAAIRVADQLG